MGKIKEYINEIVENGSEEYMECLADMLSDLVYNSPKKYEYKMKLYGMANDYKFDEELAKEIVEEMKPLGEYWDYETTTSVKNQYMLNDISEPDFYIVMNSLANDYNEVISTDDVDTYVKMAKAFINDEDACENKVWVYYNEIPK